MTERNLLWHQIELAVRDALDEYVGSEDLSDAAGVATDAVFETLDAEGIDFD